MFRQNDFLFAATSAAILIFTAKINLAYGQVCESKYGPLEVEDLGNTIPCDADYKPDNCDFEKIQLLKAEDFERCGPAELSPPVRNYFLGGAGRGFTAHDNLAAYERYVIVPKILRDVSRSSLEIKTMGQKFGLPIGLSPIGLQNLVHPDGELATIRALSDLSTVFIVASTSSASFEDIADEAKKGSSQLWLSMFFYKNRTLNEELVSRAERAGYKAIVIVIDLPQLSTLQCNARKLVEDKQLGSENVVDSSATFKDISWLRGITKLPVVVKGILSASDTAHAIRAGASAIFVSNHGGRALDSDPATIDVLPSIVEAANRAKPRTDVYLDGGIRNGWGVYKALALGAKMVFIGRPFIWGLAMEGEDGVREVMSILRNEFKEAMELAGSSRPSKIKRDSVKPAFSECCGVGWCGGNNWDHDSEIDWNDENDENDGDPGNDSDNESNSNENQGGGILDKVTNIFG